jgi:hypothetical protein
MRGQVQIAGGRFKLAVGRVNGVAGQDRRPLHHVAQFSHVAGPVVRTQACVRGFREDPGPELASHLVHEVSRQQRYVVRALAEGRESDFKARQAMIEIEAKGPALDFAVEVPQGQGDDAHTHGHFTGAAHAPDASGVERAKKLWLQIERKLANFVQDQGARGCFLKPAAPLPHGACERASFMAEEFAGSQFTGQSPAVDDHVRPLGVGPQFVQETRHQLLASATFARDQHRGLGRGDAPCAIQVL